MKSLIFVISVILLFTGCTINMTPTQQQVEAKKEVSTEQVEKKTHEPWPKGEKEYWYA